MGEMGFFANDSYQSIGWGDYSFIPLHVLNVGFTWPDTKGSTGFIGTPEILQVQAR